MPSFTLTDIPRDTGSECRAQLTDANGAVIVQAPGIESATPGLFDFNATYAVALTYPLYWEVRTVTAQTTAGFNAGTDGEGPWLYDSGSGGASSSGAAASEDGPFVINPGGTVSLTRRFRYPAPDGPLTDLDASPGYTLFRNGVAVGSPTIVTTHAAGSGIYRAVATAAGFVDGDSGELEIAGTYLGRAYSDSVEFTVVDVTTPTTPGTQTVTVNCKKLDSSADVGAIVQYRLIKTNSAGGNSLTGKWQASNQADSNGQVVINLTVGYTYGFRNDRGEEQEYTPPSAGSDTLPFDVVGRQDA